MERIRTWHVTLNNYTAEDLTALDGLTEGDSAQLRYLAYCTEVGEKKKTPHFHAYCHFFNPKTLKQVRGFFGSTLSKAPHIEPVRGSIAENKAYLSKQETMKTFGTLPRQGTRTDLKSIRTMIQEGKNMAEIAELIETAPALRSAELLMKYQPMPKRNEAPTIRWYWGPSGTGKTHRAFEEATAMGDTWVSMNGLKWWQGYYGQKYIILDEFRGDACTYGTLLRFLDKYPIQVENKGSSCWMKATHIWITSNKSPEETYRGKTEEALDQLVRRITHVEHMTKRWKPKNCTDTEVRGNTSPDPCAEDHKILSNVDPTVFKWDSTKCYSANVDEFLNAEELERICSTVEEETEVGERWPLCDNLAIE